jgi:DNA-binding NtrC family response regulator
VARTILVVEDSAPVRGLVKMILEDADYTVLEAANRQEALAAVQEWGAGLELVICDLQLPEGSGLETGNRIGEVCPGLRILYMSGHDVRQQVTGATEFIMKPFRPDELLEKIRTMTG